MGIIPIKVQVRILTIRKHLSLLLAILLVVTMTSQAAAAYVMSCQGTASCCCLAPKSDMGMNGAMPGGMDQNCCDPTPSDPCEIETNSHAAVEPFLSGFVTGSVDNHTTAGMTAPIVDPDEATLKMARLPENYTDRDGPPIYLQTQHFLC